MTTGHFRTVPERDRLARELRELVAQAGGSDRQQDSAAMLAMDAFYAGAQHALSVLDDQIGNRERKEQWHRQRNGATTISAPA